MSLQKDPQANLDYGFDWTTWLGTDTISTSTWSVTGPDSTLVIGTTSKDTVSTTVWLSGGTVGATYYVTNHIVTAAARADDRQIVLQVVDK